MENQPTGAQDNKPAAAPQKSEIGLPLAALGLSFAAPVLFFAILILGAPGFVWLLYLLSPLAGLTVGIAALRRGKARIGTAGKVIAIIAVALPLSAFAFVVFFFIGASTGIIALM